MKLLLDTHTFIWLDSDPTQLSFKVQNLCQDPTNQLLLSMVSIWEMVIKLETGKLTLRLPLVDIIEHQQHTNNLQILPLTVKHILGLQGLPLHHRDPFDRLLITQANLEGAILVSKDAYFSDYTVQIAW